MNKKKTIIIILIIIIIAIVAIFTIMSLSKKNPEKEKEQLQEEIINNTHIIEGVYSDEKVTNYTSAKKSLESVKKELNIENLEELKEDSVYDNSSSLNIYSFYQTKNGIKVYDSYLSVYTDKEGTVHGVIDNLKSIKEDIGIKDIISKTEAKKNIEEYLKENDITKYDISKEELLIYPYNNQYTIVYYFDIGANIQNINIIISAKNGEILEIYSPYFSSNITEERISKYKVRDNYYEMVDKKRNLTMYKAIDADTEEIYTWTSLEDAKNKEIADSLDYFEYVTWIYDFYSNNYNIKGFGEDVESLNIYDNVKQLKYIKDDSVSYFDLTNNATASGDQLFFGYGNKPGINLITHEYTHGIFANNVKHLGVPGKENVEQSSVNEAYADIMSMALEAYYEGYDNIDGTHGDRDIKNSDITYNEFLEKGYSATKREEHYYSFIISRVAYDTSNYLTLDEYTDLWFDSMFLLKGTDCNYYNVRYAVIRVAESRFNSETIEKIKESFDKVGIINLNEILTIKKYDEDRWPAINEVKKHKIPITTKIPNKINNSKIHSYKIFESDKGFEDAKKSCIEKGGYLAAITSEEENKYVYDFIISQGYKSAYFGLTDIEDNTWKWVNGETLDYTNWEPGEPNHENDVEHYAMYYWKFKYTWNDGDFATSTIDGGNAYICEFE